MAYAGYDSASDMANALHRSSWGELTSQTLQSFLEDSVRISKDEIGQARDVVVLEVERILQGVTKADLRFGSAFQKVGGYIEGLKVSDPDEFDFLVPLMKIPKLFVSDTYTTDELPDASFLPVRLSNRAPRVRMEPGTVLALWQRPDVSVLVSSVINYPFVKSLLKVIRFPSVKCLRNVWAPPSSASAEPICCRMSPENIMGILRKYVRDVIRRRPGQDTVQKMWEVTTAVTLKILYNRMEINVDLVPFIKNPFNVWSLDWPRPGVLWPSQSKIDEIKATGVDLVAKHPLFWMCSYSRMERVLLENIDEDGEQRRNSLRILKKVRQDRWKPKFEKKVLVSYHLKNVLFWACEKYPNTDQWQDLAESFKRLVDMLIDFLSQGNLPLFFLREVNLFKAEKEVLSEVLLEVLQFRASPMAYFK